MLNRRFRECVVAAALALVVCASPAWAQRPRPDRAYRGLFGGNGADPNSMQQLDLNVSLLGAYDDNVLASTGQIGIDPRFQKSGGYGNGTVSLDYTRRGSRATVDFTGGTSYRYFPSLSQVDGFNYFSSFGVTAKLSPHTDLRATESASYSPFFSLGAIPGLPPTPPGGIVPISPTYPLLQNSAMSLYSSASLTHRVTPRSSFSADYSLGYTDYRASDRTFDTWLAGGQYSYSLSSRTSMNLGYHYRRYDNTALGVSQPTAGHEITVGMASSRPLSASRTMTYGFTVGTSLYQGYAGANPSAGQLLKTHVLVTANAFVTRQISRSWSGNLSYSRGVQYVEGFASPFFSDSFSAGLSGFLSARSQLDLRAAYSNGQAGISTSNQGYRTYSGVAGYQFALSKFIALTAEYNYYHYIFDPTVVLPAGMNRGLNRQSVRVGLNLWVPLLR